MKKLSLAEVRELSAPELVERLRNRDFSLLQSLGFRKLRAEMNFTGIVCRSFVNLTGFSAQLKKSNGGPLGDSPARRRVCKVLGAAAPGLIKGKLPHFDEGMVVGFNHPSLGEILRFIYICITEYRSQRNLFPVNQPWYEALMPIVHELEQLGIYIMPVITPSTRRKMAKTADEETMQLIDNLSAELNILYLKKCVEFIKSNDNVWLAPSATRQRTVFTSSECVNGDKEIKPQTMTYLAITLKRGRVSNCKFLPIGVNPCPNFKRGLNLFKQYRLSVGEAIDFSEVIEKARTQCKKCAGSEFEHDFLMKIAYLLLGIDGQELVFPN